MILSLILATLGTADAKNKKSEPFMWGVGPTVGTYIFPFAYPSSFPKGKDNAESPRDNMDKMDGDIQFGAKGTLYMNRDFRLWGHGYLHRGKTADYKGKGFTIGVDKVLARENGLNFYVGGGAGMSGFEFDQGSEKGNLSGRQLYAKVNAGALYRNVNQAYDISLFAMMGATGQEVYAINDQEYVNEGLFSDEAGLGGGVYMPVFGVEGTFFFGDFKPNKGKKGKKGKGGRR